MAEAGRKRFAAELLQTIERERQRVARELHDDVGQAVATIGVLLDTLDLSPGVVPDTAKASLASTRATIMQITESLARIVREYHPVELLGLGLEDTVRTHARQLAERHGLTLHLSTVNVEGRLTPEQELHVYRVVQEALANTARHARATSVTIDIERATDAVQATDQLIVTVARRRHRLRSRRTGPRNRSRHDARARERSSTVRSRSTARPVAAPRCGVVLPLAVRPVVCRERSAPEPVTAGQRLTRTGSTRRRRRRSRKCSISTSSARWRTWRASRSSSRSRWSLRLRERSDVHALLATVVTRCWR